MGNWAFGLHLVPSVSPEYLLLSWVAELVVFSQGPYPGGWGLAGGGGRGVCFEFSDLKRLPMAILSSATNLQLGRLRPGLPWVPLAQRALLLASAAQPREAVEQGGGGS